MQRATEWCTQARVGQLYVPLLSCRFSSHREDYLSWKGPQDADRHIDVEDEPGVGGDDPLDIGACGVELVVMYGIVMLTMLVSNTDMKVPVINTQSGRNRLVEARVLDVVVDIVNRPGRDGDRRSVRWSA